MLEVIFLFVLGLVAVLVATIQDVKLREVANWISFSLIIFAMGFRFFYSLFSNNFSLFYQGFMGLAIFFVIGNLFYYMRIFAGGDAKLMIALGAVFPIYSNFVSNLNLSLLFLLTFLVSGSIYSLFISFFLSIKNHKSFRKEFKSLFIKYKIKVYAFSFIGIIFMAFGFLINFLFFVGIMVFLFFYLYIFAKAVDNSCMVKKIFVNKLREGDWLYEEVKVGKKHIKPSWEGLSKEQIKLIQSSKKKVVIRHGIPFVPNFLISYILFYIIFIL